LPPIATSKQIRRQPFPQRQRHFSDPALSAAHPLSNVHELLVLYQNSHLSCPASMSQQRFPMYLYACVLEISSPKQNGTAFAVPCARF
jgi:hypothetical protein